MALWPGTGGCSDTQIWPLYSPRWREGTSQTWAVPYPALALEMLGAQSNMLTCRLQTERNRFMKVLGGSILCLPVKPKTATAVMSTPGFCPWSATGSLCDLGKITVSAPCLSLLICKLGITTFTYLTGVLWSVINQHLYNALRSLEERCFIPAKYCLMNKYPWHWSLSLNQILELKSNSSSNTIGADICTMSATFWRLMTEAGASLHWV